MAPISRDLREKSVERLARPMERRMDARPLRRTARRRDLPVDPRAAPDDRAGARVAAIRGDPARCRRRSVGMRAPPPALVLPDHARRPDGLFGRGDRDDRRDRALSPRRAAEGTASGMESARSLAAPLGGEARGDPARRRRARPRATGRSSSRSPAACGRKRSFSKSTAVEDPAAEIEAAAAKSKLFVRIFGRKPDLSGERAAARPRRAVGGSGR